MSIYPGEICTPPRTEKFFNLQRYSIHDEGGHVAPLEIPDTYVDEVQTFLPPVPLTA